VIRYGDLRYRIDRAEQAEAQLLEAVRIEPGVYIPSEADSETIVTRSFAPPVPVLPVFLDLPLLTGEEVPHAPHVAVAAEPWPGSVALWSSAQDSGYELNRLIAAGATVGVSESPLSRARPGIWDRGAPLRVKLSGGELSSGDTTSVLNGANAMAIGDGTGGNWEVFQFATAQVVAPDTFDLSMRLRGQLGTDGVMPDQWPVGSTLVLLDLSVPQIDLPLSARGLARYYRCGSAARGFDDPNVVLRVEAFDGVGLRPYPVCHIAAEVSAGNDLILRWKRRTRIDGDSWQAVEVPLGEESESYLLRVVQASAIRREYAVGQPSFTYTPAMKAADLLPGAYSIEVAQLSTQFGPGPFRTVGPFA
jgi:hypothetical protein